MTEYSPEPEAKDPPARRIHLIQGEFHVTAYADVLLTTTLGSCVATCIRDPVARIGGMNHFLLPHGENFEGPNAQRYGAYAMELLINAMLRAGARRNRLEAKLFGGALLDERLPDIGALNVEFAHAFLVHEKVAVKSVVSGGRHALRVQFWPVLGRVRHIHLADNEEAIFAAELHKRMVRPDLGSVELFETHGANRI